MPMPPAKAGVLQRRAKGTRSGCIATRTTLVSERQQVGCRDIDGGRQGGLVNRGDEWQVALLYQIACCRHLERVLARSEFTPGRLGEAFTVAGSPDQRVSVGGRNCRRLT